MMTHAENLRIEKIRLIEDKKEKSNQVCVNGKWVPKGSASGFAKISSSSVLTKGTNGVIKIPKLELLSAEFLLKELAPVVQLFM